MSTPADAAPERFHPLLELTKARLREFFREPGMIFWVFGFPIVMAIGLGLAFRSQPPEKPAVAVLAPDGSEAASALLSSEVLAAARLPEAEDHTREQNDPLPFPARRSERNRGALPARRVERLSDAGAPD